MNKRKIVLWILVIIWMGLIFYFSSQNADDSTSQSRGIITSTNIINNENISPLEQEQKLLTADVYLRKTAHACVFLVLSVLVCLLIHEYIPDIRKILTNSFIVCFLYSCSDEIHQIFVPGRSCETRDILIDNIGVMMGLLIFYILWKKIIIKSD